MCIHEGGRQHPRDEDSDEAMLKKNLVIKKTFSLDYFSVISLSFLLIFKTIRKSFFSARQDSIIEHLRILKSQFGKYFLVSNENTN